ncbi:hypothetical protein O6H91_05G116700 [Diphasiastrum complanatum]|uniref:Uncharacterized protein n=2 Tax=Diphasiastrum complanatum TaxID=34168 RepID=A0ACC2DTA6_DIPCM|nr:hypothetical protein O6H91_05G116700 [Diphasiastrum complanatum]
MASLTNTHESTIEVLKIPHFDLRSFCQDELYLAAHFSGPSSKARFPDIVIPTIDKALFNPSIGSRKQTYSRRSRGRPRAEQNFSSSLSLQSRAGIQLSIAKQFKDLTAEILGSTSRRLSSSSTRNAHTVTGSGFYLDEPQNWTIRDLDHVNHKESRVSVLSTAERLAFAGSLSSQSVDREKSSENESSDGDLSGHTNIPKLVVNSDTKRVEAPSEGEEVTLQQELERASQSVGKEADSGEISAIHRPLKKMRIKEGARKRSVSEIIACQSLPRHVGSKGNDIMKEASSFVNGKTKRKGSEVLKLPLIELQNNRTEEGARVLLESIVVQGLPQRVESKAHDSVEKARACVEGGNEGKSFEDQQLPAAIELQNDAKERPKEDWKVREKEAVLLECLCKMEGMWLSNEMAKKVVDAKGFPKGWKVTIGLNKKNGRNFFEYRNYKRWKVVALIQRSIAISGF